MVFKQPLRQTQGLMRSIAELLGVTIAVPYFSTLLRRSKGLILQTRPGADSQTAIHLVVDSTGLKIFGEGEWLEEKHKTKRKRRSWRKLHLGLDLVSGEIVCSDLTTDDVGDPTALPVLLDQVDGSVGLFLAEVAYDGSSTLDLLVERFGSTIAVTIPPPTNAVLSPDGMAEVVGLQSAEPGRNFDGSLEDRHQPQAQGAYLRKSEDRGQDWRPNS